MAQEPKSNTFPFPLPSADVWSHVAKLSIQDDRPIMMDYYADSFEKKALIGIRENKEKLLVKNSEEYTSPVSKIYRISGCFIICTENSIYIVSDTIPTKKIL